MINVLKELNSCFCEDGLILAY